MTPPSEVRNDGLEQELPEDLAAPARPSALRTPISRVRSVTLMVMIAITPMPPTISAIEEITTSARKMPLLMPLPELEERVLRADVEVALLVEAQAVPGAHDLLDLAHGRVACGTSSRGITMIDTSRWTMPKMRSASAP